MRRLFLLFGAVAGIVTASFVLPAQAAESEFVTVQAQVTTMGQERLDDNTRTVNGGEWTCEAAQDKAVCDLIVLLTPREVVVGDATRNVTLTLSNEPCGGCTPTGSQDEIFVYDNLELRTRGVDRLHGDFINLGGSYTNTGCSNQLREIVCDAVMNRMPQEVNVGNEQRGVTVGLVAERQPYAP